MYQFGHSPEEASSQMSVGLVGDADKPELTALKQAVESQGGSAVIIDPTQFPGDAEFTVGVSGDSTTQTAPAIDATVESPLDLSTVKACYIDSQGFSPLSDRFQSPLEDDFFSTYMQIREHSGVLQNILLLLHDTDTTLINSFGSLAMESQKIRQLHVVEQSQVRTPDTIATNSPDRGDEFIDSHDEVIVKPVTGGGKARLLTDDHWKQKRDRLNYSPVQIQEYIPGTDIRVYYTGSEIISASSITTDATDHRDDPTAEIESTPITPAIQDCVETVRTELDTGFGAIDLVESDSELYFLEVNVAPLFVNYSRNADANVAEAVARYLIATAHSA